MAYNTNSQPTTVKIIEIVDGYTNIDKSAFIEDVLNMLTEDQRQQLLYLATNSLPLQQFV